MAAQQGVDAAGAKASRRPLAHARPSTSSSEAPRTSFESMGAAAVSSSNVSLDSPSSSSSAAAALAPVQAPAPIAPSIIPPRGPKRTGMPTLKLPSRPSTSSAAMIDRPSLGTDFSTSDEQRSTRPARISLSTRGTGAVASSLSQQQSGSTPGLSLSIPSGPSFGGLSSDAENVYEGSAGKSFPMPSEANGSATNGPHLASIYPDTVPYASGSMNPQALTNDLRRAIGRLSLEECEDAGKVPAHDEKMGSASSSTADASKHANLSSRSATSRDDGPERAYSNSTSIIDGRRRSHSRPTSSRGRGSGDLEDESDLQLEGNLEMLNRLGEGASGEVRKARYRPTGIIMAMKTINISPNPNIHRQILRELAFSRTCHSEYIVRYFGAFLDNEDTSIVIGMELCEGGSLDGIYKRVKQRNGRMGEKVLAKIAESGLKGLAYLHERKIIHRDIKPSNILVTREGLIKLCDFGVSGELIDSLAGTFTGTSFYMAPERIRGLNYTITSDVWSLGLTVLELASNRFPFPAEGEAPLGPIDLLSYVVTMKTPELKDDPASNVRWTRAFRDFIEHCLEKDGGRRHGPVRMLNHPWIKRSQQRSPPVDVGRFVAEVWGWPVSKRIEDAAPDSGPHGPRSIIIAEDVNVPGLGRVPSIRQAPRPFAPLSTPVSAHPPGKLAQQRPLQTPPEEQEDSKGAS